MELETMLYSSEGSSSKDLLLRKCRDTIHQLESELDNMHHKSKELESHLKESLSFQSSLQKEIQEKSLQLHLITKENNDLGTKYESFIQKALIVQQDNESLQYELEITTNRYRDCETSLSKTIELLENAKTEVQSKNQIIKEWNSTVSEFETRMKHLTEENGYLKEECEKRMSKEKELEKKLKDADDEKCIIFKSFHETKEKLALSRFELENKSNMLNESQAALEESRHRTVALEISLTEVAAKAKIAQEESKSHRVKADSFERQVKELTAKYNSEMERMNKTLENKSSFFSKEDNRKLALITHLETDLKILKDELESLTAADSLLQSRYRDLLSKLSKKKDKMHSLKQENSKMHQSLLRFEEKLKTIESSYLSEAAALKQENSNLSEKLKKTEKFYSDKLDQLSFDSKSKSDTLSSENSKLKSDLNKYSGDLTRLLSHREEEISLLNEDRQKLQIALSELESKVVTMSRNLETSVADCWRLSSELSRCQEVRKDEMNKLGEYYKVKLGRKDEEFQMQNEKYTERLKDKIASFYEKASKFKEGVRRELENLEMCIQGFEGKHEVALVLARIYNLLNSFII